jgi:predicted nuclease of restriction endonuclease-like RecB superfamily
LTGCPDFHFGSFIATSRGAVSKNRSNIYDGELTLQAEEVESGFFADFEEVLALSEKDPFTPDGLYVLKRFFDSSIK